MADFCGSWGRSALARGTGDAAKPGQFENQETLAMSAKKPASADERTLKFVGNPDALKPLLKQLGGSQSDDWNNVLTNQTLNTVRRMTSGELLK
jgi:hypothetical protein